MRNVPLLYAVDRAVNPDRVLRQIWWRGAAWGWVIGMSVMAFIWVINIQH